MAYRMRSSSRNKSNGFAYLWVLFAVFLLGLGMATAMEVDSSLAQRSKEEELLSQGQQFRAALRSYYSVRSPSGTNEYPQSLNQLVDDRRDGVPRRHLRKIFVDPLTGKASWGLILQGNRIVGVHSLSTLEPIKQAGFDDEELSFVGSRRYSDWKFLATR